MLVREMPRRSFLNLRTYRRMRDSIRQFANHYGLLLERYSPTDLAVQRGVLKGGSTVEAWKVEIADLRCLVGIWRAIESQAYRSELKKIITWKDDGVRYSIVTPKKHWHAWLVHPTERKINPFTRPDVVRPAIRASSRDQSAISRPTDAYNAPPGMGA